MEIHKILIQSLIKKGEGGTNGKKFDALFAQTNLWNNSNNILGTDLSRILYNESVREEILSYIKIQLADGISNINSEVLTFIITQQLSEKNGSGE